MCVREDEEREGVGREGEGGERVWGERVWGERKTDRALTDIAHLLAQVHVTCSVWQSSLGPTKTGESHCN